MSKPPVGGGVRRYEAGGGVTERLISVVVQKSGEFVLYILDRLRGVFEVSTVVLLKNSLKGGHVKERRLIYMRCGSEGEVRLLALLVASLPFRGDA
jgi:hypothetical protein